MMARYRMMTAIIVALVAMLVLAAPSWAATDCSLYGLVHYWSFDDPNQLADDCVGGGDGLLINATAAMDVQGAATGAISFPKKSSTIELPSMPYASDKNFTIAGWVKTTSPGVNAYHDYIYTEQISTAMGGSHITIALFNGRINARHYHDYGADICDIEIDGWPAVNDGNWHHFAFVRDGPLYALYIDGDVYYSFQDAACLFESTNVQASIASYAKSDHEIGRDNFNGSLDDLMIFDWPLTNGDIMLLYNDKRGTTDDISMLANPARISEGIIGYFDFDTPAAAPDKVRDVTYQMPDRPLGGNATFGVGKIGQGLALDGEGSFAGISPGAFKTLSMWVYPESLGQEVTLFGDDQDGDYTYAFKMLPGGRLYSYHCSNCAGPKTHSSVQLPEQQWSHIVVTSEDVKHNAKSTIYVNGVEVGSDIDHIGVTHYPLVASLFGCGLYDGDIDNCFNGTIDEIMMYDRVVSANEVAALYNGGDGVMSDQLVDAIGGLDEDLVGYWDFDILDGSGDPLDITGHGHDGVLGGSAQMVSTGKVGDALDVDGIDSFVSIPHDTALKPQHFTLVAWMRPRTLDLWPLQGIVSTESESGYGNGYLIGVDSSKMSFVMYEELGDDWTNRANPSTMAPQLGDWYHIVATYNDLGFGTMDIYVNGLLDRTIINGVGPYLGTGDVFIGKTKADSTGYFDGTIDEVMIYNRTLSGPEVAALYNGGAGMAASSFMTPITAATTCQSPVISGIQCQIDGIWSSCGDIGFGDQISGVRATCAPGDNATGMTAILTNQHDKATVMSGVTTQRSGDIFTLDIEPFTINDSGLFTLSAACLDSCTQCAVTLPADTSQWVTPVASYWLNDVDPSRFLPDAFCDVAGQPPKPIDTNSTIIIEPYNNTLTCFTQNGDCPVNTQGVFSLSRASNGHVGLYQSYPLNICCAGDVTAYAYGGICGEEGIISLSANTNSHAQQYDPLGLYNLHVCMTSEDSTTAVSCTRRSGSCQAAETCVYKTLTTLSNTHVGSCATSYPEAMCCGIS